MITKCNHINNLTANDAYDRVQAKYNRINNIASNMGNTG